MKARKIENWKSQEAIITDVMEFSLGKKKHLRKLAAANMDRPRGYGRNNKLALLLFL